MNSSMTFEQHAGSLPAQGTRSSADVAVTVGLALGGILGIAGTVTAQRNVQAEYWAIDGVGLIVAMALLSLRWFRKNNDLIAAGFLVYAIGESVMLAGTATTLQDSAPSFIAGMSLWSAALLLTCAPKGFPIWVRTSGLIASFIFAISSARAYWGEPLLPTSSPLPSLGYPFLILTFAGWIWSVMRRA